MIAIIDTSSLLALVRYYVPYDAAGALLHCLEDQCRSKSLIVVDEVFNECKRVAQGVVVSQLLFLSDKQFRKDTKLPLNTESLIPPDPIDFFQRVDSEFVRNEMRRKLKIEEYEVEKDTFIQSADLKQIMLALRKMEESTDVVIVTEESRVSNDNKLYKKIPAICEILDVKAITLPEYLAAIDELHIEIYRAGDGEQVTTEIRPRRG